MRRRAVLNLLAAHGSAVLTWAGHSRVYSSQTAAPSIKAQLRELYKRVHPDLFSHYPQARQTNEASFKLLQEYIATARSSERPSSPYHFVFYIRRAQLSAGQRDSEQPSSGKQAGPGDLAGGDAAAYSSASQASSQSPPGTAYPAGELDFSQQAERAEAAAANVATDGAAGELQRISLSLPPPSHRDPAAAAAGQYSRTTHLALARLLTACGLEAAMPEGSKHSVERLQDFLPGAAELLKQRETQQKGPRHQLAVMRSALRLGRRVTVGFAASLHAQGAEAQTGAMERLVGALDQLPDLNLAGLNIILGYDSGVDHAGAVRLAVDAPPLEWTSQLMQVGPEECRRRQMQSQTARHLESAVAHAIGVSMIYPIAELAGRPAYTTLLQRLAYHATTEGAIRCLEAREVPLRIEPAMQNQSGAGTSAATAFAVDEELGFISVPVNAGAAQVFQGVKAQAAKAQSVLHRNKGSAERAERLRHSVESRLGLRRLLKAPDVPAEGFRDICQRMLQQRDALRSFLEGTSVRIAQQNSVAVDGAHIDIDWRSDI